MPERGTSRALLWAPRREEAGGQLASGAWVHAPGVPGDGSSQPQGGAGSGGRLRSGADDVFKGQVQAVHIQCRVSPRLGLLRGDPVTKGLLETTG